MTLSPQEAIAMLEEVMAERGLEIKPLKEPSLERLGVPEMGQRIATKGCSKCGGTMYKTVEVDDNGNPVGEGPWVCASCGGME